MQSPPESESLYQAAPPFEDGSGSGDGRMSPDSVGDDEDAITGWQEQGSGSGDSAPAVTQVPDSDSGKRACVRAVRLTRIASSRIIRVNYFVFVRRSGCRTGRRPSQRAHALRSGLVAAATSAAAPAAATSILRRRQRSAHRKRKSVVAATAAPQGRLRLPCAAVGRLFGAAVRLSGRRIRRLRRSCWPHSCLPSSLRIQPRRLLFFANRHPQPAYTQTRLRIRKNERK